VSCDITAERVSPSLYTPRTRRTEVILENDIIIVLAVRTLIDVADCACYTRNFTMIIVKRVRPMTVQIRSLTRLRRD